MNALGEVSGSGTYKDIIDGLFDASGVFDFTGSLNVNTPTLNTDSQDTVGDTCTGTGSMTVSR